MMLFGIWPLTALATSVLLFAVFLSFNLDWNSDSNGALDTSLFQRVLLSMKVACSFE